MTDDRKAAKAAAKAAAVAARAAARAAARGARPGLPASGATVAQQKAQHNKKKKKG